MSNRLYTNREEYKYERGRNRKKRPKTFKSKESAKRYAEKHNIKINRRLDPQSHKDR